MKNKLLAFFILIGSTVQTAHAAQPLTKVMMTTGSFSEREAVMYVAQNLRKPTTFVVAIRGTNPISLSDWISGDLLATETVPWPYGSQSAGADISLSTALGLSILQHLRSTPLDNSSSAPEPQSQITWLESLRTLASRWFRMGTRASDGFNSLAELLAAAKVKQAERASISALKTLGNEQNRLLPERLF